MIPREEAVNGHINPGALVFIQRPTVVYDNYNLLSNWREFLIDYTVAAVVAVSGWNSFMVMTPEGKVGWIYAAEVIELR